MHIPPASSAAQAASITSQSTSKGQGTESPQNAAGGNSLSPQQLEKSEQSNADRDAQGQGDGLPAERHPSEDELELSAEEESKATPPESAGDHPDSPPGHLDIIG